MKRLTKLVLAAIVFCMIPSLVHASPSSKTITVMYEKQQVTMTANTEYTILENTMYVTATPFLLFLPYETLPGKATSWDDRTKTISFIEESINPYHEVNEDIVRRFSMGLGNKFFYIGKTRVESDHPMIAKGSTVYLPLRDICEGYDLKVNWDQTAGRITIEP